MTGLPAAAWREDPALHRTLEALTDARFGRPRAVGGAVRDTLAGIAVTDVDLATPLRPDEVVRRLQAAGLKAVPTGIAHGTVTAVADGKPFEVTTLRRDVATDGRRAKVAFADDWAEDAQRRDFTINAMYADPVTGELFDPVGGRADLAAGRVRFIGDAATRIAEDHLRIMRWFRFDARFGGGEGDPATEAVIAAHARTLRALSRERVADELLRLLALPDPAPAVARMARLGVLAEIAGEAMPDGPARLERLVRAEAAAQVEPDVLRRLIALGPADAERAEGLAARLRLSTRQRKHIAATLSASDAMSGRELAYRNGAGVARDAALLRGDATAAAELAAFEPPLFPLRGRDLIARGVPAGPEVARLLKQIEAAWIAKGFPGSDGTAALVDAALGQAATAR